MQIRVITTNAAGQDEWVGIDDIEVTAAAAGSPGGACPGPVPAPAPAPTPSPAPDSPAHPVLELSDLALTPEAFTPLRRGAAIVRRGGAGLRFRLTRAAPVRFEVIRAGAAPQDLLPKPATLRRRTVRAGRTREGGRFSVRGKRGLNRLRFSGRVRGPPARERHLHAARRGRGPVRP